MDRCYSTGGQNNFIVRRTGYYITFCILIEISGFTYIVKQITFVICFTHTILNVYILVISLEGYFTVKTGLSPQFTTLYI